tara:strand:+ start:872 stop:1102 length:231 start_codon:yes stop_codon:yes gene_type:complete
MLLRVKPLASAIITSSLLLIMLCLGAQNLSNRHSINLALKAKTAPLPVGFLVGVSIVIGVLSGGAASALITPKQSK